MNECVVLLNECQKGRARQKEPHEKKRRKHETASVQERESVCVWVCRDIGASVSGDKQEATGSFLEITGHGKLWAGGDE